MDLSGARGCYLSLVMAFLLSYITPTSVLASDEEKGESINASARDVLADFEIILVH